MDNRKSGLKVNTKNTRDDCFPNKKQNKQKSIKLKSLKMDGNKSFITNYNGNRNKLVGSLMMVSE